MINNNKLGSLFALTLLMVSAIDSIRNLPSTALFGPQIIFFCIIAAITFLVPIAWLSGQLALYYPENGGIYSWLKLAFPKPIAIVGIWLQWINTIIWYPTILSFIAGTMAYSINPDLIHHRFFLFSVIVGIFWLMTIINLFGVRFSAYLASLSAMIGVFVPMAIIIICAIYARAVYHIGAINLSIHHWIPRHHHGIHWSSLTAIIASYLGIELASVHSKDIDRAQSLFPRALLLSVIIIVGTMIMGSLAIASVIPASQLSLIEGVMQSYHFFFQRFHLLSFIPWLSLLLVIGSMGNMINWIISPSKGLVQASEDGQLPHFLSIKNSHGVAPYTLIAQALLVSLISFLFTFIPSINSVYWFLTDLSTELYLLMYILLIVSAWRLLRHQNKKIINIIMMGLGLLGCSIAFIVGFIPPTAIRFSHHIHYSMIFLISMVIMISPGLYAAYYSIEKVKPK